jgi:hypothetical protein
LFRAAVAGTMLVQGHSKSWQAADRHLSHERPRAWGRRETVGAADQCGLSTRSVAASIASNGSSPTSAAFIPTGLIFFAIALRGDRSYSLDYKIG